MLLFFPNLEVNCVVFVKYFFPKTGTAFRAEVHRARHTERGAPPPTLAGCRSLAPVLTDSQLQAITESLPTRCRDADRWKLCYSTLEHGVSINTFYHSRGWTLSQMTDAPPSPLLGSTIANGSR